MTASTRARILLADALNADVARVPEDARIGGVEEWDSIAHLRLILALEAAIGRQLDPDEVVAIESLSDIEALVGSAATPRNDSSA